MSCCVYIVGFMFLGCFIVEKGDHDLPYGWRTAECVGGNAADQMGCICGMFTYVVYCELLNVQAVACVHR